MSCCCLALFGLLLLFHRFVTSFHSHLVSFFSAVSLFRMVVSYASFFRVLSCLALSGPFLPFHRFVVSLHVTSCHVISRCVLYCLTLPCYVSLLFLTVRTRKS